MKDYKQMSESVLQRVHEYEEQNESTHARVRSVGKVSAIVLPVLALAAVGIFALSGGFGGSGIETGSSDTVMIGAATQYLRIDSLLYVLVAVIFIQRNSMQGVGDAVTPLISSGIEMVGKIILAFTLVPALGYFGVILVEPIVWIVMIIPLILKVRTWKN